MSWTSWYGEENMGNKFGADILIQVLDPKGAAAF
jgi:hypothetical protein